MDFLNSGYEFSNCSSLVSLKLSSIREIYGTNTFQYCTSLRSINFSRLTKTGENSFLGCINLINVSLQKINIIPSYCFKDCVSLKNLLFENVDTLEGEGHFSGCVILEILSLPKLDLVNEYSTKIFENCINLKIIILPNKPPSTFNENIFITTTISVCLPNENSYANYTFDTNESYWKGINIQINDNLKEKCSKFTYFPTKEKGIPFLIKMIIGCLIAGIAIVSVIVLLFWLYRKNKKEKESLENMPHLTISIIDNVV